MADINALLTLARLADMMNRMPEEFRDVAGTDADRVTRSIIELRATLSGLEYVDDVAESCSGVMDAWGEDLTCRLAEWVASHGPKRKPLMPGKSPRVDRSPKVRFLCNRLVEFAEELPSDGEETKTTDE